MLISFRNPRTDTPRITKYLGVFGPIKLTHKMNQHQIYFFSQYSFPYSPGPEEEGPTSKVNSPCPHPGPSIPKHPGQLPEGRENNKEKSAVFKVKYTPHAVTGRGYWEEEIRLQIASRSNLLKYCNKDSLQVRENTTQNGLRPKEINWLI